MLRLFNTALTAVFTVESILKILAFGVRVRPISFCVYPWNRSHLDDFPVSELLQRWMESIRFYHSRRIDHWCVSDGIRRPFRVTRIPSIIPVSKKRKEWQNHGLIQCRSSHSIAPAGIHHQNSAVDFRPVVQGMMGDLFINEWAFAGPSVRLSSHRNVVLHLCYCWNAGTALICTVNPPILLIFCSSP